VLDDKKTPFFDPNLGVSHFVYSGRGRGGALAVWGGLRFFSFKTYVEQKQQPYQMPRHDRY